MSGNVIDLPPSPPQSTADEAALLNAPVRAVLMNGKKMDGRLATLDGARAALVLHCRDKTRAVIRFSQLRHLDFLSRHPVNREEHPLPRRGEVVMPEPTQAFRVLFSDGRRIKGRTRGSLVDNIGLHFFQPAGNSRVSRLFIPSQVVRKYYVGPAGSEPAAGAAQRHKPGGTDTGARSANRPPGHRGPPRRKTDRAPEDNSAASARELEAVLELQTARPGHAQRLTASKRIGEMMVEDGLITPQQLAMALKEQRRDANKKLGQVLIAQGAVDARDLYTTLARKFGLPFVKLRNFDVDMEALTLVPAEVARRHEIIPLFNYKNRLVVAMDDPTDSDAINMLRFITHHNVELTIAMREDIEWAINKYYGLLETAEAAEELQDGDQQDRDQQREQSHQEIERLAKEKPIVRFVNNTVIDAIQREASDIHIRPLEDHVDLLFRIDGALVHVRRFSKVLLPAVVSRIKIMGAMDIAERRVPQDGRTSMINGDSTVDLRISVMPTIEGESVVIRILNTSAGLKPVDELGFSTRDQKVFVDMLHKSYGMLLVTGPTGSGKSTTLYAALNEVRARNVNVITVEDPVEYHIPGIEQIQVNNAAGYSFAKALRHILRHDPDVIMVGEIRDQETGKIAVESALTGHLVLSTLHTNDAASAVTRLMEMGVEPYLLSATLLGALAQRLVRRNCTHCMEEEAVDTATREALGVTGDEVFYRGAGCEHCNNTGYHGRLAVYELLRISPEIHSLIISGGASGEIHRQAIADGMVPLTDNALIQARLRKTSLAEVYRVRLH